MVVIRMVFHQSGLSPSRPLIRVAPHQDGGGLSSGWPLIRVVVVSHQGGLLSGRWPVIRAASDQVSISTEWPLIRVVCYHSGLSLV